jgi:hypothetical protein
VNPVRRRAGAVLTVATVFAAVAGCGVQLDDEPRPIAREAVPFDLLETSTTGGTSTTTPLPTFQATSVFLVDNNDFLVEVRRQLPGEVRVAIGSLLTPPTEIEVNSGLSTAIPPSVTLRGVVGPEGGLVTINLGSGGANDPEGAPEISRLAFAQLVYTATSVPGVERVLFQVDGQAREVPTGQGQSTAEPLSPDDYRQFIRPRTSRTSVDSSPGG